MTTALLIATPASAQPWEGGTVLGRLEAQLNSLDVEAVHVIEPADSLEGMRAVAERARDATGDVLVGYGDVVTHREALAALLRDPRVPTGILASDDPRDRPTAWGVRTDRGRVLSVGSPYHSVTDPNHAFLGFVKVAAADREALVAVADAIVAWLERLDPAERPDDVPALLAVGLVRSGMRLSQSFLRELFWARPLTAEEVERAAREIQGYDEQQVVLDSAVKATDGFFTSFFVSPYSKYIARWAARRGLTPNQVTTASMAVGTLAAAAFATGERWGLVAGALLLQLAFTLDCVDGQLARYTMTFTKFGAWLDSIFDRGKEYVVYAGLAIGASHAGDPVWMLAGAALTLQTVRHMLDFSFAAAEQHSMEVAPQRPFEESGDGARPKAVSVARPQRVLTRWERMNRVPGLIWVKRAIVLPIGERFAVVSLTAAIWDARVTFAVLLVWGGLATAYGLAGRLLRSMR